MFGEDRDPSYAETEEIFRKSLQYTVWDNDRDVDKSVLERVALKRIVGAMLQTLTTEQRAAILEALK